ncbi:hypothetical protein [Butyricicoccus sp.]|uniref:hypothetical protein n=1 Tax=Butyricicoccus sp. TaxID=2049021 RepID=UPI003F152C1F
MNSNHVYTTVIRWAARIATFFCICLLLTGIPASAARMGSVDVNGSEVAYQAQYKAYTEAASDDDALVCYFTVSNPTAGKNGALCRIILPQSQNVYLYMDAGALAVMRYDGSEYKKFSADYPLKRGITYTLCVFRDGLVLFDGIHCYTYSGNFYGFTDVIAGWSDDSNVFSTELTKKAPAASTDSSADTQEDNEAAVTETEPAPASDPYPSIWVVLALLLGTTSNLLALVSLRSSNMALRTVYRVLSPSRPASHRQASSRVSRPTQSPVSQKAPAARKPAAKQSGTKQPSARKPAAKQSVSRQQPSPAPSPKKQPAPPVRGAMSSSVSSRSGEKRKPTLFFTDEPSRKPASKPAPARNTAQLQPIDLYTGPLWHAHTDKMVPYHFSNAGMGYCIFSPGTQLSAEMFARIGGENYIWLNPVRFHAEPAGSGVLLRMSEIAGIAMAFDFYHAGTGKREIAIPHDVHMVQFRPAQVKPHTQDTLELSQRGMIVFEPVQ